MASIASKFSFAYVKKNPVMFGAIVVVFGLLFWLLINRGAGGSTTTTVNSGPSEALQAANLQAGSALQAKQIDAAVQQNLASLQLEGLSRQIEGQSALAAMEMQLRLAESAANERLSGQATAASLAALQAQLNTNMAMTESNNQFMVDYARVAADSATTQLAIGAMLQRDLGAQQLEGFKFSSAMAVIPTLKKKNRDDALLAITARSAPPPINSGYILA